MPSSTYLPRREADLLAWSNSFNTHLTGSGATFGIDPAQAGAYSGLHNAFASAYSLASDPATRTPTVITTKNDAKRALINNENGIRDLVGIIQNYPGTTDPMRTTLGITIRDDEPTPIPPPAFPPNVEVTNVYGHSVSLRLHDSQSPTNRGRPDGVSGATIFSSVGAAPPTALSDWKFEGNTTKTHYVVDLDSELAPGTQVWFTAFWRNPQDQTGPAASPIHAYIGAGVSQAA